MAKYYDARHDDLADSPTGDPADDPGRTEPWDAVSHANRVNRSSAGFPVTIEDMATDLHAEEVWLKKRETQNPAPKRKKITTLAEFDYLPCGFCHSEDSLTTEGIDLVCKVCSTHFGHDYVVSMIARGF